MIKWATKMVSFEKIKDGFELKVPFSCLFMLFAATWISLLFHFVDFKKYMLDVDNYLPNLSAIFFSWSSLSSWSSSKSSSSSSSSSLFSSTLWCLIYGLHSKSFAKISNHTACFCSNCSCRCTVNTCIQVSMF